MFRAVVATIAAFTLATVAPAVFAAEAPAHPLAPLAVVAPVASCDSLARLDLASVTGAATTQSSREVSGAHPYCKVTGNIARSIHFEVHLPMQGWTQRFLQTGCGGLCGVLRIDAGMAEGCTPVTDGSIALASTDMGHQGFDMGGAWGANQDQRIDFAYRGVHVTALAAKALIRAYYGQVSRYSYFSGCSDGGREALIEAQRYPQDFDGIAAGAPAINFTIQNSFHHGWVAKANTGADGRALLTAADMKPLHNAVLKVCDGLDGLTDGQITDPRRCRYDPAPLRCEAAYQQGQCLTAEQIAAVRKIYAGATGPDGEKLEVGPVLRGSELEWVGVFVPREPSSRIASEGMALGTINHLLFTPNPNYTLSDFSFTSAQFKAQADARKLYNADDPNLTPFAAHGGKLILWHGWSDPHISPLNSIDYYERVGKSLGASKRDSFVRMFLFPGMSHCSGGDGPNEFPLLASLMAWVESGQAPQVMVAHRAGPDKAKAALPPAAVLASLPPETREMLAEMARKAAEEAALAPRSRPVFAYPAVARYSGKGSQDDASSFVAGAGQARSGAAAWIGSQP
ncbi:MAG TPA: tannase/feruloyl esterase family alpha/beta hydrolase [Sphingobium sp.]|uniref:tannase/feruloyl esterase family alpha/beta hydrolase n=1 Tax=Sphingobium sp. TaxID=1912891 RepID=UPI002ED5B27D